MPSLSLVQIMNHHVILITLLHPADLWQSACNPYSAVTDVEFDISNNPVLLHVVLMSS